MYLILWQFCSNEAAKLEKNIQNIFAFVFKSKEMTPFSFINSLHCFPLEELPREFKVRQSSYGLFLFFVM